MKKAVKFVCFFLVLCLLSGACVCFADGGKDYSGYKKYVSLGDSIPAGIGENNENEPFLFRTPDAYPDLLAKALGAELTQLACGGMRTVELRACLEDDYIMPDEYTFNFTQETVAEIRSLYAPAITDADIITINIGTNDFVSHALVQALAVAAAEDIRIDERVTELEEQGYLCGALLTLLKSAENTGKYAKILAAVADGFVVGYTRFCKNWDAIIGDITRMNPDAVVLAAGLYNPLVRIGLTDDSLLKIGKLLNPLLNSMNRRIKYGSPYSDKYIYVDIMGVESLMEKNGAALLDEDLLANAVLYVHPSLKGHAEIAQRFLDRIPEKAETVPGISVPTGRLSLPINLFTRIHKFISHFIFLR